MPHGEAIRQSQLFLSYGSFDRILSDVRTKAPTLQGMRTDFRIGFFVGIAATLAISVYCYELWQQERQVLRHSENLFRRIEDKNWSVLAEMIASDYQDQWGNDRALVLETNSTRFELSPSFPD